MLFNCFLSLSYFFYTKTFSLALLLYSLFFLFVMSLSFGFSRSFSQSCVHLPAVYRIRFIFIWTEFNFTFLKFAILDWSIPGGSWVRCSECCTSVTSYPLKPSWNGDRTTSLFRLVIGVVVVYLVLYCLRLHLPRMGQGLCHTYTLGCWIFPFLSTDFV